MHAARAGPGDGLVRIERQRPLIVFRRLLPVALFLIGEAEAGPGRSVVIVHIEGGVEILDRLVIVG